MNFCTKLLFYLVKIKSVFVGNQIDSKSKMTISATATNAMKVGFSVLWEIKVDDDVNCLDVNTTRQQVYRQKEKADLERVIISLEKE